LAPDNPTTPPSWLDTFFSIGLHAHKDATDAALPDFPLSTRVTVESTLGFTLSGESHNAVIRQLLLLDGRLPYEPLVTFLTIVAGRLGGAYLDIGANIGYCSVLAASASSTPMAVHAFEPCAQNFSWLRRNAQENGKTGEILQYLVGLGAEDGSAELSQYGTGSSFVRGWDEGRGDALGLAQVAVRRLDSLITDALLTAPTFVKIDVEGYELPVLRGGERTLSHPNVAGVLAEIGHVHHPGGYNPDAAEAVRTLETYGYRCFGLRVVGLDGDGIPSMEVTAAEDVDMGEDGVDDCPGLWLGVRRDDPAGAGEKLFSSLALFPLFLQLYPAPIDRLTGILADMG
jgi:FkbM family methyltransferase